MLRQSSISSSSDLFTWEDTGDFWGDLFMNLLRVAFISFWVLEKFVVISFWVLVAYGFLVFIGCPMF